MITNDEILKEIKKQEETLSLYNIKVFGVSLWRLVRFRVRLQKLVKTTGYINRTKKDKVSLWSILKNYFISFFQLVKLIIVGKKYDNIVLAFPRLTYYNGEYFDKFTDPIISQTSLKKNTIVIQKHLRSKQFKPRFTKYTPVLIYDFIDYSSKLWGICFFPLFYLLYAKKIYHLYKKARVYFGLEKRFFLLLSIQIGDFYFKRKCWQLLLWRLKPKNIFLVNGSLWFPCIATCKRKNITVYELQHGINHAESALFTGTYDPDLDADYFLMFGEKWREKRLGISLNRLINIGWAYKSYMLDKLNISHNCQTVLVVSSPPVTERILKTTIELANAYPNYQFSLRLHPHESLSTEQLKRIEPIKNIKLDDKKIDSLVSVLSHEYCIGENSSVLYEALAYGKKVGKIMYNGLYSERQKDKELNNIFYLRSQADFKEFINKESTQFNKELGVYDDFKIEIMENILNNKLDSIS